MGQHPPQPKESLMKTIIRIFFSPGSNPMSSIFYNFLLNRVFPIQVYVKPFNHWGTHNPEPKAMI